MPLLPQELVADSAISNDLAALILLFFGLIAEAQTPSNRDQIQWGGVSGFVSPSCRHNTQVIAQLWLGGQNRYVSPVPPVLNVNHRCFVLAARKPDRESCMTRFRADRHLTMMGADDGLGNRQPQSGPLPARVLA